MIKWTSCYSQYIGEYDALYLGEEHLGDLFLVPEQPGKARLRYLFVCNKQSRYLLGGCREYIFAASQEEAKQKAVKKT